MITKKKKKYNKRLTLLHTGLGDAKVNPLYDYLIYLMIWKSWRRFEELKKKKSPRHSSSPKHKRGTTVFPQFG